MSTDVAQLIVALVVILGAWTATVVGLVIWLTGKFRELEQLIYKLVQRHSDEDDENFKFHDRRINRVEMQVFGFTEVPVRPTPPRDYG